MSLDSYGITFGLRVSDPAVLRDLARDLPPGWKPVSEPVHRLYSLKVGGEGARRGVRNFHLAYADAEQITRTMKLDEAIDAIGAHMRHTVAEYAAGRIFVHAGVVGWKGRAILIPARSLSGKSQLVAALIRAGATYYSDEYAVLDARGRVHPYARPLSLRTHDERRHERVTAQDLGGREGRRPLPVGLIVDTKFATGKRWRPRSLQPGRAFLALLANTVSARRNPDLVLPTLTRVAREARALTGTRGEAAAAAEAILKEASKTSPGAGA